jgi:AcrR family transcriptional regulator
MDQLVTKTPAGARRGRGGRPTKDEIRQRGARVLAVAADLFIQKGFSATTIDEIAKAANVAKRTLYKQYPNKGEIFRAVVRWRVADAFNPEVALAPDHQSAEEALLQLAKDVVRICTDAGTAQISQLLVSGSVRFPDLTWRIVTDGTQELIHNVSGVLAHLSQRSRFVLRDTPENEARRFCDLMVGMSALHVAAGVTWSVADGAELRARVQLFMGARAA